MTRKIIVTGGAIIRDSENRILLQRRSDYGDWGLPGGGMEPGESVEETMIREVLEETGLEVREYKLHAVYSGKRMEYTYPDGNEVVFVMFIFDATVELTDKIGDDGKSLSYQDEHNESLQLIFKSLKEINIDSINPVQKPIFEDLLIGREEMLRV
ncbi:NUDIX domain-containing protein [Neobacillus mesonae]|nr:NUDIX domain-containing protein [Neobacillus mesonae]